MNHETEVFQEDKWIVASPRRLTLGDRWYFFAYRTRQRIAKFFAGAPR